MMPLIPCLRLFRFTQYIKNGFIFMPLFFAGEIVRINLLSQCILVFAAFCLLASSVYILNDLLDMEEDQRHPLKRLRPLANGQVSLGCAVTIMSCLSAVSLSIVIYLAYCDYFSFRVPLFFLIYLGINVLYSYRLKHMPIIDVSLIAIGFVLRLLVGASAAGVRLTVWIIVMTFLLALFIAFAKRRSDVIIFEASGEKTRRSVDGYNLEFLNAAMVSMASVVIVSYIMYTISPDVISKFRSDKLYLTTIFVVLGILRYIQIAIVERKSDSPTQTVLTDKFLQLILLGWFFSFGLILYWG